MRGQISDHHWTEVAITGLSLLGSQSGSLRFSLVVTSAMLGHDKHVPARNGLFRLAFPTIRTIGSKSVFLRNQGSLSNQMTQREKRHRLCH